MAIFTQMWLFIAKMDRYIDVQEKRLHIFRPKYVVISN
jgi:hypothetical protein